MNCPRDGEVLEVKSAGETPVPTCPRCGGLFLEHGQLNKLAEPTPGDLEFSTVDLDTFQHDDEYGPITCPRDSTIMVRDDERQHPIRLSKKREDFAADGGVLVSAGAVDSSVPSHESGDRFDVAADRALALAPQRMRGVRGGTSALGHAAARARIGSAGRGGGAVGTWRRVHESDERLCRARSGRRRRRA